MMHVQEGDLQAYLDHEVAAGARADIDKHLHSCSSCAAELARLQTAAQLFSSALRETDVAPPMRVAQARLVGVSRFQPFAQPVARSRRAFARAAMFILGLGAVASAAVPGSPVRAWLSDALTRVGLIDDAQVETTQPPPVETPAPDLGTAESTALAIDAVNGRVRIVLRRIDPATRVSVEVVDNDRAVVEASGAAAKARFRTGVGLLEVVGADGGAIVVRIPRAVSSATVMQDGKMIFRSGR